MSKGRLEAFSDGVLAVVITIMVLELKSPHGTSLTALRPLVPVLLSYIVSFVYVGIYWNNHHHLLFWLSLIPFTTAWVGDNYGNSWPVAVYGIVLLSAGVAYYILARVLIRLHGNDSTLARSIGNDRKGKLSIAIYAAGIAIAFAQPWIANLCYVIVAIIWLVPDRRIERKVAG
jgi:uncharacterized membrane protein